MGKKVKSLTIKPQSGSNGTYFASWDFTTPYITSVKSSKLKAGSIVAIKSGAKYYNGASIPSWVFQNQWYVVQVTGDRVVLGENTAHTHNIMSPIKASNISPVSGTDDIVTKKNTLDHYTVKWYYATGDGVWFDGGSSDVTLKNVTYSAPGNAKKIKVSVKPVSKKYKKNNKDTNYWTGTAVTKVYSISETNPDVPQGLKVELNKYKLTASVDNISDGKTDKIEFQVYKGNKKFKTGIADVKTARASFSCDVKAGDDYRVRCRAINVLKKVKAYSAWTEYSNSVNTIPSVPSPYYDIKCYALSETSIRVDWPKVKNATKYEVQYSDEMRNLDGSTDVSSGTYNFNYAIINGLETGKTWFFRVRAVNDVGESGWTSIARTVIGKDPAAPTTWSSTTTAISGDPVILYWVHNSEDGSKQTKAQIELDINGKVSTETIMYSEDDEETNSSYSIDTSTYVEGVNIKWRVRTMGVTGKYGDWSIQRVIDIYAPPTLEISVTDKNGVDLDTVTSFPFYLSGIPGPETQTPTGYSISISANESYYTIDNIGNEKIVSEGEVVYSRFIDTNNDLLLEFMPSNIDLENGVEYTITCILSMNSGLTAEATTTFDVSWIDEVYEPDASISFDDETLVTYIKPYCVDDNEDYIENIHLSVYRREYDGKFTEIETNISNVMDTTVVDPHPSLDYARYRIVAISDDTGSVSYYDVPAYPINEKAVIIQWDESWSNFDVINEDELEEPPWSGSLLRLPYNIDVDNSNKIDVSLIEYYGRSHPVSYYGTQVGETATWKVSIDRTDIDTLYALRRLSKWMGDVYVREPSGSGYWASISVSYNQTHGNLTIPVTMNVTRVEGGK